MKLLSTLLVSMILINDGNGAENRCLVKLSRPRRRNFIDGKENLIPIKFEMTESMSQRILSWIMNIYLDEVLGYNNIEMEGTESQFDINSTLNRIQSNKMTINMEVWIPVEPKKQQYLQTLTLRKLIYITPLGQTGWIGWFVPPGFSEFNHWTMFNDSKFATDFPIDLNLISIIQNFTVNHKLMIPENYNASESPNGTYIPQRCRNNQSYCTIMLTNDVRITDAIKQIEEMGLYIKLHCVGSKLEHVISLFLQSKSPSFFILRHWVPSELVFRAQKEGFLNIELPDGGYNKTNSFSLQTIISPELTDFAPTIIQIITNVNLTDRYYTDLSKTIVEYPSIPNEYDIACNWLINNYPIYSRQRRMPHQDNLTIEVILPTLDDSHDYESLYKAIELVEKAINQKNLMENYVFKFPLKDIASESTLYVLDKLFDDPDFRSIGTVGPGSFDELDLALEIAKMEKSVLINFSLDGEDYDNREKNAYYFQTIGPSRTKWYVMMKFFEHFDWHRVVFLDEGHYSFHAFTKSLQELSLKYDISEVNKLLFPGSMDSKEMKKYLLNLIEQHARILYIGEVGLSLYLAICEAHHLNMTAEQGYVWIFPWYIPEYWWDKNLTFMGEDFTCTSDNLLKVINGSFRITQSFFGPDDQIMQENITIGEWKKRFNELTEQKMRLSDYTGLFYDACWIYFEAIKRYLKQFPNGLDVINEQGAEQFAKIIAQTDFYGLSGRVRFNGGNTRVINYEIQQFVHDTYRTVGKLYLNESGLGTSINGSKFILNTSDIVWLSKSIPDDGHIKPDKPTPCVLEAFAKALHVSCEIAIVILFLIIFVVLGIIFAVGFIIFKRRYDRKVRMHKELLKSQGLLRPDLDEWEIPRHNIVLNRTIGEGAFGTVYGGEALLSDQVWIPVAVKTLKVGSQTEAKCDFLSEVEVMKRFDHPNVVQLLGVCIKSEPVLTVMEFMLYGDMRTYLRTRKHLIRNQGYETSDEIGYERLTRMALDVIRALSYLEQLKYIHRDVASRNCLVNAERVVKLADFGMTRSIYENDYYRLTRKGMFPVRWMAPESLSSGHFTSASDIWSFGILLYEIITFGKTPYSEYTNERVLDHVKSGKTLFIPNGVKPTLKNLMNSCWIMDRSRRPTAVEITSILVENPCLLEPCLHTPSQSHINQLDFKSPEDKGPSPCLNPNELASDPPTSLSTHQKMNRCIRSELENVSNIDVGIELADIPINRTEDNLYHDSTVCHPTDCASD